MSDILSALDLSGNVSPSISINSTDLSPTYSEKLVQAVVDTHLHLPGMFELTFEDTANSLIGDLMIRIGSLVEVYGGASWEQSAPCLIKGEVTSIEGDYQGTVIHTIVRGYEKSHRLQRATHSRTFVDMTDADIAGQIARDAGLTDTDIDDTTTTHKHISQIAQTDWDFLKNRAQEIGYEVGVAQGTFFFKKPSSAKPEGGGLGDMAASAASSLTGGGPPTLTFQQNLINFRPRRTAGNMVKDVEVRVWDPKSADVVVGSSTLATGTAKLDDDPDPSAMADSFSGLPFAIPQLPNIPGLPSLGVAPSQTAQVVTNRPLAWGPNTSSAADAMAKGVAEHLASTVLEAEGYCYGDGNIMAGKPVKIDAVAEEFKGTWIVTQARHIFTPERGGFFTSFVVSGRQDRSLLGLTSIGRTNGAPSSINGFVIGVVTNNNDPDTMGRVKLGFPWLTPSYESDWARVVQMGMGKEWGALFLPEVGDEVLVGFEFGDVRRPYVMGGLINGKTTHDLLSGAVKSSGMSGQIVQRGIVSRVGNRLQFDDEIPSPLTPMPPTTAKITLGDKDGKLQIVLDTLNGELTVVCNGGVLNPIGKITIEQKATGGTLEVKSAGDVTIEASAPGKMTLKGGTGVSIDAGAGMVELKGSMVKLN